MKAISLADQVIHVADRRGHGGPALVFANSLGTDLRVWDRVVAELPSDWRLVRYDKAGHGLSGLPAPPTIAGHADQLAEVMTALVLDRAVIVGLSVGGMIAQSLAARRPDLVAGLVLIGTGPKIGTAQQWDERIASAEADGIDSLADGILARWFTPAFRAGCAAELALWRAMLTRTPATGYAAVCAAIRDADLTEETRRLSLPALCLVGAQDGATPPDLVRGLSGLIAGAGYHEIAGAGHLPPVEQPQAVAQLIIDFVKEAGLD